jgi:hypothetical protein
LLNVIAGSARVRNCLFEIIHCPRCIAAPEAELAGKTESAG